MRIFDLFRFATSAVVLALSGPGFAYEGLAILGDSLSMGAGTHPDLEFDSYMLWNVFNGHKSLGVDASQIPPEFRDLVKDLAKPVVVDPSLRENDGGTGWLWHHLARKLSQKTLDEPRLSYGYFVGRKLGFTAENILFAGENGSAARHAWIHASRVLEARDKDLPSHILMLYSGNDLCSASYDGMTAVSDYKDALLRGMKYLVVNGYNHSAGTKIFVPSFLPVTAILHEPSILDRKIRLYGEEVTCKEARKRMFMDQRDLASRPLKEDAKFQIFSAFLPPNPMVLCPTLFSQSAEVATNMSLIANRIREFRLAQEQAVNEFNQWRGNRFPHKRIEAVYIEETSRIKLQGEDISGDCFHLSAHGQAKVALELLKGIY